MPGENTSCADEGLYHRFTVLPFLEVDRVVLVGWTPRITDTKRVRVYEQARERERLGTNLGMTRTR